MQKHKTQQNTNTTKQKIENTTRHEAKHKHRKTHNTIKQKTQYKANPKTYQNTKHIKTQNI